ncbi:hypothetical protein PIB30_057602 [Stylosanthes scabra]|uniref:Ribonuclease H1 N-terminal domain-containing protein n=1 Tax=Stylosanthes scabra TaxID=79078 RepID=A0ABU6WI25_9FABA|nr:hypothetical protein [Stylosanthes scabra]
MARQKMKMYVVFCGRRPGLYSNWPECNEQVHRYGGGLYQSFDDPDEARRAWEEYLARHHREEHLIHGATSQTSTTINHYAVPKPHVAGNGSGSTNPSVEASHSPSHKRHLLFILAGLLLIYVAIVRK